MLVQLDQFAPDADNTIQGAIVGMEAMIPTLRGYRAAPSTTDPGLDALASACFGSVVARKLDNTTRFIAGTATKLYEISGTSWADVSASAYNASIDVRWTFAQFGNVTLATNKGDTIQQSASGAFAAIAGAPKAKLVETVNQFVFAADVDRADLGGDSPDRWICAAIGTYTDWTPNTATQCVSGRLTSSSGRINAIKRLGDGLVAYKDRSMYVGSYVGTPEVWAFQEIPGAIGCLGQGAVANIGAAHVFLAYDNFYRFDGSRPEPIGNLLKDWFFSRLYTDYAFRIKALHDRRNSNVYFFYPSNSGGGVLDSALVFNYRVNKWGVADRTIEDVVDYVAAGLTFASSFATSTAFADAGATGTTFDSPILVAGQPAPAFFDASHDPMLLTGVGTTWQFATNDFGDDNAIALLSRVKPRFLTAPTTAQMINKYRMVQGAAQTTDVTTTYTASTGAFDVLRSARWHQLDISGTGPAELGALDVQMGVEGSE